MPVSISSPAPVSSEKPIPEAVMALIQERALGFHRLASFGVKNPMEEIGFESLLPALVKGEMPNQPPRVRIGNSQCTQPYEASLLNGSALSFGPMGKQFILAYNKAALEGGFFQNSGEAGLSPYHLGLDIDIEAPDFDTEAFFNEVSQGYGAGMSRTGDLVWQIGTGYFSCRTRDGDFDVVQFQRKANLPAVKMIELKLSQGVEPCQRMPVKEVTVGMAKLMGLESGDEAQLRSGHSAFSSPMELLAFVRLLRVLSNGKPIGLKLGVSHRQYFMAICKAMLKTRIYLDFITVDGMEGGTAAASMGSLGFTGTSLSDAIPFVHNVLVGCNLREHIKIIASGRVLTERDMVSIIARGADLCATARGMLLAAGCDQQQLCYSGCCPKGIATQDPDQLALFDLVQNSNRMSSYHRVTILEFMALLSIAGVKHPDQLGPSHIQRRISASTVAPLSEVYEFLSPGSLLTLWPWWGSKAYRQVWKKANPYQSFARMFEAEYQSNGRYHRESG